MAKKKKDEDISEDKEFEFVKKPLITSEKTNTLTPIYDNPEVNSTWSKRKIVENTSFESILNSFVNFINLEAKAVLTKEEATALIKMLGWAKYFKDKGFLDTAKRIVFHVGKILKLSYATSNRVDKILHSLQSWQVKAEGMKDMKSFNKMMSSMGDF